MTVVHKVTFSAMAKTTFPVMRIEPTRPTTSTARVHQIYSVSQDHQKAAAHLTSW